MWSTRSWGFQICCGTAWQYRRTYRTSTRLIIRRLILTSWYHCSRCITGIEGWSDVGPDWTVGTIAADEELVGWSDVGPDWSVFCLWGECASLSFSFGRPDHSWKENTVWKLITFTYNISGVGWDVSFIPTQWCLNHPQYSQAQTAAYTNYIIAHKRFTGITMNAQFNMLAK